MRKLFVPCVAVALGLTAFATDASAQCVPNAGPFCIDGTIPDPATGTGVVDPNGNTKELGPVNGAATKIGVINTAAVPMLEFTNPNASVDLNLVYLSAKTDPLTGHVWVYFAWFRDSNNGSGFIALEGNKAASPCTYPITTKDACNPWAGRANGDPLFSWDQQGNSHDIYLRVFSSAKPGFVTPTNCIGSVGSLGCLLDPAVARAEYNADFTGGELAIDLTALFDIDPTVCTVFGNVIPTTVTGNSDTADYKDAVLEPLSIDLCGRVTIEKVTQTAAGAVFVDPTSVFQYKLASASITRGPTDIKAGPANIKTESDLPPGSDYKLTETTVAIGYTLLSIACGGTDLNKGATAFTVTVGTTKHCVITNRQNPNLVTANTLPHVALRDEMFVQKILRITGDNPAAFTIVFRLYDSETACNADTARTAGTAFVRTVTLGAPDGSNFSTGYAQTHPEGSGVQKPAGTYAWWARFSGNQVNGLDINLPKESTCNLEKVLIGFPQ
jgi:hypothetical protein